MINGWRTVISFPILSDGLYTITPNCKIKSLSLPAVVKLFFVLYASVLYRNNALKTKMTEHEFVNQRDLANLVCISSQSRILYWINITHFDFLGDAGHHTHLYNQGCYLCWKIFWYCVRLKWNRKLKVCKLKLFSPRPRQT